MDLSNVAFTQEDISLTLVGGFIVFVFILIHRPKIRSDKLEDMVEEKKK